MKRKFAFFITALLLFVSFASCTSPIHDNRAIDRKGEYDCFRPGARWYDTDGALIQAHGGQIQRMPVPMDGEEQEMYV